LKRKEKTRGKRRSTRTYFGKIDTHNESASLIDLYSMGIKTKYAQGPNPLSVKRRIDKKNGQELPPKKRRLRKGKRSKPS